MTVEKFKEYNNGLSERLNMMFGCDENDNRVSDEEYSKMESELIGYIMHFSLELGEENEFDEHLKERYDALCTYSARILQYYSQIVFTKQLINDSRKMKRFGINQFDCEEYIKKCKSELRSYYMLTRGYTMGVSAFLSYSSGRHK